MFVNVVIKGKVNINSQKQFDVPQLVRALNLYTEGRRFKPVETISNTLLISWAINLIPIALQERYRLKKAQGCVTIKQT